MQSHLSALLDRVNEVRHRLGREGDFVLRLQALMWESGCHPLQNDERYDPMYGLLQSGERHRGITVKVLNHLSASLLYDGGLNQVFG